jgi:hypothetical protein
MAGYRAAIWGFVLVEATALLVLMARESSIDAAFFVVAPEVRKPVISNS